MAAGTGTKDDPWILKTPPGTSEYRVHRAEEADKGGKSRCPHLTRHQPAVPLVEGQCVLG